MEVQALLPQLIKFKKNMEHQFKIGDRVRVIGSRPADWVESPIWTDSMDKSAGKEGIVLSIGKARVGVIFEDGSYYNYKPSWLTPVPTEDTPLLKVGDCIKVLRNRDYHPMGTALIIEKVDSNDQYLPYRAGGWWYRKDDVEHVTPSCVEPMRISTPHIDAIKDFFGVSKSKESVAKLPLISKTKLLTTIKLD